MADLVCNVHRGQSVKAWLELDNKAFERDTIVERYR